MPAILLHSGFIGSNVTCLTRFTQRKEILTIFTYMFTIFTTFPSRIIFPELGVHVLSRHPDFLPRTAEVAILFR